MLGNVRAMNVILSRFNNECGKQYREDSCNGTIEKRLEIHNFFNSEKKMLENNMFNLNIDVYSYNGCCNSFYEDETLSEVDIVTYDITCCLSEEIITIEEEKEWRKSYFLHHDFFQFFALPLTAEEYLNSINKLSELGYIQILT